jgi:hypothetical protein
VESSLFVGDSSSGATGGLFTDTAEVRHAPMNSQPPAITMARQAGAGLPAVGQLANNTPPGDVH